jgi:hypothetical protein
MFTLCADAPPSDRRRAIYGAVLLHAVRPPRDSRFVSRKMGLNNNLLRGNIMTHALQLKDLEEVVAGLFIDPGDRGPVRLRYPIAALTRASVSR